MTINKRKKNSRLRGSHTHGWGEKKKHRGGGSRGGKGNSGTGKRADSKKPSIWKEYASYFGKHGFVNKNGTDIHPINLQYLENHIASFIKNKKAELKNGVYVVNLTELGYNKLLSKGNISKKYEIIVDIATENAITKVEEAGGSVTVSEKEEAEEPVAKKAVAEESDESE
jgi:large subunit ribosomal protein L15